MGEEQQLSVVIPTTGPDVLGSASIRRLDRDPTCSEVLVVINGAGRSASHATPPSSKVRILLQEQASLSAARNLGLSEASRGIVGFIDDDAEPCDGWCDALLRPFLMRDDVAATGGPALPEAGRSFPRWMGAESLGYLGLGSPGTVEEECRAWQYPWGCNFAVRRDAAKSVGGFREDLGYRGARLVGNEEIELFRRLQLAGYQVWCAPAAAVTHHVSAERVRLGYLIARAYWQGVADRITANIHRDSPVPSRVRCAALCARWVAAALFRLPSGDSAAACAHLLRSARALGSLLGPRAAPP
jgi:GT2 family glycosyltransferase